jgi:hypothetical protein
MNSLMKSLVVFCALCALGISGGLYVQQNDFKAKCEANRGIVVNVAAPVAQDRIINLPEDGNVFYTSLFLPANWQKDGKSRTLRAWFDTQYQLSSLKSQTHFNVVTNADPQWNAKYASTVTVLPCIALTDSKGTVYYKASGETIPPSPTKLASAIDVSIEKRCPNRRCPWKDEEPAPQPPAVPDTTPVPDTPHVPDSVVPDKSEEGFPLWLGLLLGTAGAGLAVGPDLVKKWKAIG